MWIGGCLSGKGEVQCPKQCLNEDRPSHLRQKGRGRGRCIRRSRRRCVEHLFFLVILFLIYSISSPGRYSSSLISNTLMFSSLPFSPSSLFHKNPLSPRKHLISPRCHSFDFPSFLHFTTTQPSLGKEKAAEAEYEEKDQKKNDASGSK